MGSVMIVWVGWSTCIMTYDLGFFFRFLRAYELFHVGAIATTTALERKKKRKKKAQFV